MCFRNFKKELRRAREKAGIIVRDWHENKLNRFGFSYMVENYDAEIRFADDQIARILRYLDEKALKDNTLLIILSDHGEEIADHGNLGHGLNCYNEVIRVPLIMYHPHVLPAGIRIRQAAALIDLVPTLCALLGEPADPRYQGISLMSFIRGDEAESRTIFCEHLESRRAPEYRPVSLIEGRWKYHYDTYRLHPDHDGGDYGTDMKKESMVFLNGAVPQELYDLENDREERINLHRTLPEISVRMRKIVERHLDKKTLHEAETFEFDENLRGQLEKLGYLN
jgi:arylsulfatase A-like enzyme